MSTEINCLEWMEKALERYYESIGVRSDSDEMKTEQLTIALLGQAQEGKTSLAMRLLGAKPEEIPLIDDKLRGRRRTGQSATQVPCVFSAIGRKNFDEKLERLGEQVRTAWKEKPSELLIEIPLDGKNAARVVDLVGLSARDTDEATRAQEYVRDWLIRSDIQAVVTKGSHITDIVKKYDEELSYLISRWQVNHETSLIVITFAYQSPGLRKKIKTIKTSEELYKLAQDYYQKQIKREMEKVGFVYKIPQILPVSLPSEINLANEREKLIYDATEIALNQIRKLLDEEPLLFKIRSGFTYPRRIEKEIEKKLKEEEEEQKEYVQLKEEIEKEKHKENTEIERISNQIEEINKRIIQLDNEQREMLERVTLSTVNSLNSVKIEITINNKIEDKKKYLSSKAIDTKERLLSAIEIGIDRVIKQSNIQCRNRLYEIKSKMIRKCNSVIRLHWDYRIEKSGGFLGLWKSIDLKENLHSLQRCAALTKKNVKVFLVEEIAKQLSAVFKQQIKALKSKRLKEKTVLILIKKTKEERQKKENLARNKALMKEKADVVRVRENIADIKIKLKAAGEYKKYILEEYVAFWNKQVDEVNKCDNQMEILEHVVGMKAATQQFEDLLRSAGVEM